MFRFKSIKTEWPFWAAVIAFFIIIMLWALDVWLAYPLVAAITLIVGAILVGDLLIATFRWGKSYREPWFIKTKSRLSWKWQRFAEPLQYTKTPSGKWQLVRQAGWDFFEIYDKQGRLIGTEQIIDWNMSNTNLDDDRPENVQVLVKPTNRSYQLSWLARWRSKEAFFVAAVMEVIEGRC